MDDQSAKIITQATADLAVIAARNTVGAVADKIKVAKNKRDQAKTISELEELINDLVNDKIELERLSKTLENELVSQQISDEDISFIVNTVVPLVEKFAENDPKRQEYIDIAKQLLSRETLKVMQLIGFNYREAIGAPLTRLCANAINNLGNSDNKVELTRLNTQNEIGLVELSRNKDAYNRFAKLIRRPELIVEDNPNNTSKESNEK